MRSPLEVEGSDKSHSSGGTDSVSNDEVARVQLTTAFIL